jgi:hypothetical protein
MCDVVGSIGSLEGEVFYMRVCVFVYTKKLIKYKRFVFHLESLSQQAGVPETKLTRISDVSDSNFCLHTSYCDSDINLLLRLSELMERQCHELCYNLFFPNS